MNDDPSVWVWPYTLTTRGRCGRLNRRTAGFRHPGALVRIGAGVGCLHPWTTLGDAPLDDHLASIVAGEPTRLARRTLACIRRDGAARTAGVSLFEGCVVPPSHRTIVQGVDESVAGAACIKLKAGRDPDSDRRFLVRCLEANPGLRLRVDFNATETPDSLAAWWGALPTAVRAAVDFLEDPIPWDAGQWRSAVGRLGIALALDRPLDPDDAAVRAAVGAAFQVAVIKPAVHDPVPLAAALGGRCRVVITSSMDHPIGQCFAAWEAARWTAHSAGRGGAGERHGLLTHRLFEPDPFIEALGIDADDRLVPPPGTGLGFDDLLDSLPWTRIR